jgi:hypothetical protein
MNFRVFLLIAAIAVFGALWSSDGRYQAEQVTLARAERAPSSHAALVSRETKPSANARVTKSAASASGDVRAAVKVWAVLSFKKILAIQNARPLRTQSVKQMAPQPLLGRLVVAWTLGLDPGNGVIVLTERATLAKSRFEERFCLLRFRTREAAIFASRRAAAFLRAQMSAPAPQQAGRFARIIIREIPIEESQAPPAGGGQTR